MSVSPPPAAEVASPAMVKVEGHPGIFRRGGRYVATYRDAQGKSRKRFAKTLAEARQVRAALLADVARGEHRDLSRTTFASYAAEWVLNFDGRTGRGIRAATRADYIRAIELHALPYFGRRRLAEVELRDVKTFVRQIAEGRSPGTVRNLVAPVRALFATALEEGLIRVNPCTGLRLPAGRDDRDEKIKALSEGELADLIAETPSGQPRLLVWFLADTGLRVGEAIGLRWEHVGLLDRRVRVRERRYRQAVDSPKSKYGRRDVPLSALLATALADHRAGSPFDRESDPVFSTRTGTPFRREAVYGRIVKPAAARAGVPWASPHTLRHTCATRLFRAGLNAKQVQVWLGHHSPSFTLDTYVHLLPEDLPEPSFFGDPKWATEWATRASEMARNGVVPQLRESAFQQDKR